MTIESAGAEYTRLKSKEPTQKELWAGYWELVRAMDKLNIEYYPLCDNDNGEEPYP